METNSGDLDFRVWPSFQLFNLINNIFELCVLEL